MAIAKIFVIEDNPSDISILRHALEEQEEEFELGIAPDGEVALQFVHSRRKELHATEPCVILLDLHLPRHNGLEILNAIRREPILSHIHVVVLTGGVSPREEAELRNMGADYRMKPMNLSDYSKLAADLISICKGYRRPPRPDQFNTAELPRG